MNLKNYESYAAFDYFSYKSTEFKLGDVVINEENEIGVIIQIHEDGDFRTDMFGNCSSGQIRLATLKEISKFRPNIEKQGTFVTRQVSKEIKKAILSLEDEKGREKEIQALKKALSILQPYFL